MRLCTTVYLRVSHAYQSLNSQDHLFGSLHPFSSPLSLGSQLCLFTQCLPAPHLQPHHLPNQFLPPQRPQLLPLPRLRCLRPPVLSYLLLPKHLPQHPATPILEPKHRIRLFQTVQILGPPDDVAVLRARAELDLVLHPLGAGTGAADFREREGRKRGSG
ncbi:hypothetical protein HBI25_118760 [Parastagonospora nodorum]|nr:hypothetical protein HBH74_064120 [Parastagonospora nodorum]KAH4951530.1 hypothetical protein HBH73_104520 [Parastagonospora nodorum]KAH4993665.1 hypothetical protein HBI76_028430 [Parastagonospora nodorum]KAH5111548.1 hypothetical protein HBH72_014440 [Parastagonospora nodorum]KAH5188971.1 hypothetical protein HBH76_100050 [Parastagonospora nodorum]